ncbi:hypothetical protein PIB30_063770, partial [Stylosanthes scabra]|nr:hypothetical protein [Stylosanthes scabra]
TTSAETSCRRLLRSTDLSSSRLLRSSDPSSSCRLLILNRTVRPSTAPSFLFTNHPSSDLPSPTRLRSAQSATAFPGVNGLVKSPPAGAYTLCSVALLKAQPLFLLSSAPW